MNDERDEIRRRIDLVDLVSQRVKLKRSGKNFLGLCPFHDDKTPSFNVSSSTGRYKCFACGESGDVFTWVMKTQGLEFIEALKQLADQAGVTLNLKQTGPRVDRTDRERWLANMQAALIFFRNELQKNPLAKEYLDKRQLPPDVFSEWELGYAPNIGEALTQELRKGGYSLQESRDLFLVDQDGNGGFYDKFRGRLMFPIRDEKGDLVGFGGRILGDGHPKYINSSETPLYHKSRVLYGMHKAKDRIMKDRHAVLVEGYLDVIACHRAGVTNAVASCGTALAEDQVRLIKRYADKVTILYDADTAGQKAALKASELFANVGLECRIAVMNTGEDPDSLVTKNGAMALIEKIDASVKPFEFKVRLVYDRVAESQEKFWSEIPKVLRSAPSDDELQFEIVRLAQLAPGFTRKDPAVAQRALESAVKELGQSKTNYQMQLDAVQRELKEVKRDQENFKRSLEWSVKNRKGLKGFYGMYRASLEASKEIESESDKTAFFQSQLVTAEAVVFSCAFEPKTRSMAVDTCQRQELFLSNIARKIARALVEYSSNNREISISGFLEAGFDDEITNNIEMLSFDPRLIGIADVNLLGAISYLEKRRAELDLQQSVRNLADESVSEDHTVQELRRITELMRKKQGFSE